MRVVYGRVQAVPDGVAKVLQIELDKCSLERVTTVLFDGKSICLEFKSPADKGRQEVNGDVDWAENVGKDNDQSDNRRAAVLEPKVCVHVLVQM